MKQIRFVVLAVVAMLFGVASMASAQGFVTTGGTNSWNNPAAVIASTGKTIDVVEFVIPNRFAVHPYGNFRPDAYIQVTVPVQNNTERPVSCSIVRHGSATTNPATVLGMRLASFTGGGDVVINAGSSANMFYWLRFAPRAEWSPSDYGQEARYDVKVTCTGQLPPIQDVSH